MQLDQLDVHPGNRILEIGAGTGYNAALLARLTGPAPGQVSGVLLCRPALCKTIPAVRPTIPPPATTARLG
ncbi:hypothetical protein [Amycolatopsis sp. NBC_01480]|uniref:hypothetical protein n=1 Tax=Amycolatopsis sp. NBC_01480 TaxID=2903562 RepID=UPI002E287CB7|nr:hypothetical protein [Amycolatopsis sp. NBC_01480]